MQYWNILKPLKIKPQVLQKFLLAYPVTSFLEPENSQNKKIDYSEVPLSLERFCTELQIIFSAILIFGFKQKGTIKRYFLCEYSVYLSPFFVSWNMVFTRVFGEISLSAAWHSAMITFDGRRIVAFFCAHRATTLWRNEHHRPKKRSLKNKR